MLDISKNNKTLSASFSSSMDTIDKIDIETRDMLKGELDESRIFALSLCMREGLTNAIKHGNRLDPEKVAHCTLTIDEKEIIIDIEDQGEGFDWQEISRTIPDPQLEHGRGLTIIKEYCSEFRYNEKGNKLTMIIQKR
jgi:serine/threonine-protein kinase RsbW